MSAEDVRGLAIRQPWMDAFFRGGKDVENRLKWPGSAYRGRVLLHAAAGMTKEEWFEVNAFAERARVEWRPPPPAKLILGAIVGRARVTDVIMPGGLVHRGEGFPPSYPGTERHPRATSPWYMGGFALVLEDIEEIAPMPYKGSLGFFRVGDLMREMALAAPRIG